MRGWSPRERRSWTSSRPRLAVATPTSPSGLCCQKAANHGPAARAEDVFFVERRAFPRASFGFSTWGASFSRARTHKATKRGLSQLTVSLVEGPPRRVGAVAAPAVSGYGVDGPPAGGRRTGVQAFLQRVSGEPETVAADSFRKLNTFSKTSAVEFLAPRCGVQSRTGVPQIFGGKLRRRRVRSREEGQAYKPNDVRLCTRR